MRVANSLPESGFLFYKISCVDFDRFVLLAEVQVRFSGTASSASDPNCESSVTNGRTDERSSFQVRTMSHLDLMQRSRISAGICSCCGERRLSNGIPERRGDGSMFHGQDFKNKNKHKHDVLLPHWLIAFMMSATYMCVLGPLLCACSLGQQAAVRAHTTRRPARTVPRNAAKLPQTSCLDHHFLLQKDSESTGATQFICLWDNARRVVLRSVAFDFATCGRLSNVLAQYKLRRWR